MQAHENIHIRRAVKADYAPMLTLWNECVRQNEVVYSRVNELVFLKPDVVLYVAVQEEQVIGFIHGVLPSGDTAYLTAMFVATAFRRKGIGTQLFGAFEDAARSDGKTLLVVSGNNPVHLSWRVPNTQGHDHNNAPGVDRECAGYPFLIKNGVIPTFNEVAMYMDLKNYQWPHRMDEVKAKLMEEGIHVGLYDGETELEYDGMCDRVQSEYWRNVLKTELEAWQKGKPNLDESLFVDGTPPKGPRPLLLATQGSHIIGFTGPVAVQKSGRGWFTGICVDPLYGRRSIGALLFNMLMRTFINEGAAFTTLFTGAENHAQQIYLRAGLTVVRHFAVMSKSLKEDVQYTQMHF